MFEAIAPVEGVAGNNDPPELVERFGRRRVVTSVPESAGSTVRIGLIHGDAGPGRTTPERAARAFAAGEVEVVCFGHSHVPLVGRLPDGRLLINPGSPTDRRRQPLYSWALLDLTGGSVRAVLRFYDDRSS